MGIQRDIKFDDQTEIGAHLLGRIVLRVGIDPERRDGSVAGETLDARRSLIGAIEFQPGSRLVSNDRTCPLARDTSATKPRRSGTRIRRDVSIERER